MSISLNGNNSDKQEFTVLPFVQELNAGVSRNYINGKWENVRGGEWQHTHPASMENDFTVAIADKHDVNKAVLAARRAFDEGPWSDMKARERKLLLRSIGDKIRKHADDFHLRQTLDNGVPISFGSSFRFSAHIAADIFEYFIGWIDKIGGDAPPVLSDNMNISYLSIKEPVGVVAALTPFNAPVLQIANKLAPALASGCTIVLKPSEFAGNVAILYFQLLEQLDLPQGVINLVTGTAETGAALVNNPLVDKIAFTGQPGVGSQLLIRAADDFKRVSLSLGGKSAGIYFNDVSNPFEAGRHAMAAVSMGLSGQVCSTQTRAIVHQEIYEEFLTGATSQVLQVKYGNPFEKETTSSAIITSSAADRLVEKIRKAENCGARIRVGGEKWSESPEGNWVEPTLITNVDNEMDIVRNELFGPVLCVMPFESEKQAVKMANDSDYGLSAGVYTNSPARAFRVAKALRVGTVAINGLFQAVPAAPFGGTKTSGLRREFGREGLEEYLETKTISMELE